ncbi:MAG: pyridoxal phosphate-dependent aminotransferase [Erysipelotrichaceae bacterium]|nr:pyridoxal phosphate-dependent aminotransferase [Erysipelotrichaceae bacterium]
MPVNFDKMPDRLNTNCVKWDGLPNMFKVKAEDEVLPFWVADMDFDCPQPITDALRERVNHGIFGYTRVSDHFSQSVVSWMNKRHGSWIDPKSVRFSPGVLHGLTNAILAFSKKGDGVIIMTPVYYPFNSIIKDTEREVIENPLIEINGHYEIDYEDLKKKTSQSKAKLLILCNPHNPVGRVYTQAELTKIGEICVLNKITVLSDEIHSDLIYAPYKHLTYMNLPGVYKNKAVVFISPSKTFNLAGLQTSAVILPDETMRQAYDKAASLTRTTGINVFGEVALCAAYDQCESYVDELMAYLTINLAYVRETLRSRFPQLTLFEPEGTYLLWIDFRKSGIDEKELLHFMSHTARIAIDDGSWFGSQGSGFIRLNSACPLSQLKEAFDRLESAFNQLKNK